MADSVVSFLLKNLSQLLANEANLLCGVEDKVRSLHNELEIINVFIKPTEGRKNNNNNHNKEIQQKIVSQIRDVAHVAEDVIDTFITKVALHKRRSVLGRMLHGIEHAKLLRDVAEKIDNIKTTIKEIHDNRSKYNNDFPESSSSNDCQPAETTTTEEEERVRLLHNRRRNVEEKDVVGFVHDSEVVINRLMEGCSQCKVVSIIGMGGLGKTTLARKVYNNNEVQGHFNYRAWVDVSNECRAKEILLGLVKHLMPNIEDQCRRSKKKGKKNKDIDMPGNYFSSLGEDELKRKVKECLQRKRYLIVLDDLWKNQDWDELQDAFPDDNRGSRILITSRLKEVALHTSQDPPYYLQFLTEEQSWELFSRKVFRGKDFPSDLEPLGKEIVKGCRGLPLSIVVLAGLLANKEKSHKEWTKVVDHVNWYVTQDETQVKDIVLKLSYDNLPARLKPCFLYLGIFPEDFKINVGRLLRQWVAEGFIQETRSRNPDDVAEDYLYELIDRSLVQVARVKTSGGVKACRVHDLLRDLSISESKEVKFFEVCMDDNILIPTKPRRLSIQCDMSQYVSSSTNDHSCVRSLFCFDSRYYVAHNEWKWVSKDFRLVRVLDIAGECCEKIPSSLGDFIHLRYLRIESRDIRRIPSSICTLQSLQTLDTRPVERNCFWSEPVSFPGDIWKLKQLRHVFTYGPIMLRGHHLKPSGEVMWNLQTISFIELNRKATSLFEKGMFPKLRKLGLRISSSNHDQNVPQVLRSLQKLEHLNKLTLSGIRCLNDAGMKALANLTKLQSLTLGGRYPCRDDDAFNLNCTSGFPQLQVFRMEYLAVQSWELTNGAMPNLQNLDVVSCYNLDSLPNELLSLTALRKVLVRECSKIPVSEFWYLKKKNGSNYKVVVDFN